MEHEHRYTITVGNAPVTMMAGSVRLLRRACACGHVIYVGSYRYDPEE